MGSDGKNHTEQKSPSCGDTGLRGGYFGHEGVREAARDALKNNLLVEHPVSWVCVGKCKLEDAVTGSMAAKSGFHLSACHHKSQTLKGSFHFCRFSIYYQLVSKDLDFVAGRRERERDRLKAEADLDAGFRKYLRDV